MKSVFIVEFSCGKYDDYRTSVICAIHANDEDKAERLVEKLTTLAKYKTKISKKVQIFWNSWNAKHPPPVLSSKKIDDAKLFDAYKVHYREHCRVRNAAVEEFEQKLIAEQPMPEELREMLSVLTRINDAAIDWDSAKFTYSNIEMW